jgi:ABC-type nickel/cobalt efflux system permease component RcnA
MYGNSWMGSGFGQGYGGGYHHGMWANYGGGYDSFMSFGSTSLFVLGIYSVLFVLAILWAIGIKGYALWHAAKRNEKWWFIALLIINTFGLLELIYLFFIAKIWTREKMAVKDSKEINDMHQNSQNANTHQGGQSTSHEHNHNHHHNHDKGHEHKGEISSN